jgi:16S rRNA (adenine1518-N6/adenine1519-N6)-dimethyltransferase
MYVKPKKRLGQNFLTDKNIQSKIIDCLELKPDDYVLEIGAGRADMTRLIAGKAGRVYALEIDSGLCEILKKNLSGYTNIKIINRDILRFNFKTYFSKFTGKIKVFGNIPYYISSPIIEHLIKSRDKINTAFITVQKEFAERVVAAPGGKDYSAFSCFVQYYTEPKIILSIKRNSFFPVPKVDSMLLKLRMRTKPACLVINEKLFFKVIRSAFNKRRKTLRNSLEGIIPEKDLELFFEKSRLDRNIRPENLSLQHFADLISSKIT